MNKRIVVPFLSAVTGISMAAGIGGAFAWYQYNSQVTASFVGSSVADTTLLQIGHKENSVMVWERDYYASTIQSAQDLVPVTFGQLETSGGKANSLPNGGAYGYGYPEAGKQAAQNPYSDWQRVEANHGYAQYTIYLRALEGGKTPTVLPVYLSDITIEAIYHNPQTSTDQSEAAADKSISDALRIHLAVDGTGNKNYLISKTAIKDNSATVPTDKGLKLFGPLDLDGDGQNDKPGGYSWDQAGSEITYGTPEQYQTTIGGMSSAYDSGSETYDEYRARVNADADSMQVVRNEDGTISNLPDKKICSTLNTNLGTDADYVKIVVTVWLEGWAALKTGMAPDDPQDPTGPQHEVKSSVWNPDYSANLQVRVGMTFDTGKKA